MMVERRAFSVVVPSFERPRRLAMCLGALAHLQYPREGFEVIVVDDGGGVDLVPVVDGVRDRIDVTLVRRPHGGPGAARNTGAERACGHLLAFTDDDCMPAREWLRALDARFSSAAGATMVGGRTLNALTDNVYATASQLVTDAGYAHLNDDPDQAHFCTTSNLALPTEEFRAIGGFDETFVTSEDRELCGRWESAGHRVLYAPEAIVYHAHELTLKSFLRQHFNYGRGAFQMQQVCTRRGWRQFRPDPRYYSRLLGSPFSRVSCAAAVRLAALLFVSQSASAAGLMAEWTRQRRAHAAGGPMRQ